LAEGLKMNVKLSSTDTHSATRCWCLAGLALTLGACTVPQSQTVVERLDPDTATTVIVIRKPVELVAEKLSNSNSDPFAFLAPFETDRMGSRAQYLWMSAPGPDLEGAKVEPQLLCDGQPLTLSPVDGGLTRLGLSHDPYEKPAPWSQQWYFQLPPDTLKCLADAQKVTIETHTNVSESEQFAVDNKGLASLRAFSSH
jgi:hypothetical protein